ncbi:ubiquitinyl hydrolase 1 [Malassezia caprae]|uniref:Ubiquitin carboxyl-terminal hydrolase n=1 Tax=Malassezia caprae TaxID=1381934 RepID=A0AAF0E3E4_9BASI|nr:ubiquitinyl hydrolase 1 [Malassezia caprae]
MVRVVRSVPRPVARAGGMRKSKIKGKLKSKGTIKAAAAAAAYARVPRGLDEVVRPGAQLAALLDEPIRFVGSSRDELKASMSLDAARAAHLEIVNESDEPVRRAPAPAEAPSPGRARPAVLYAPPLALRVPRQGLRVAGLYNRGNTCYLNSVMQALLHTPPLAAAMLTQSVPTLLGRYGMPRTQKQALKAASMFNPVAALKELFERAYSGASAIAPTQLIANLRKFARPLRPGRQEDAHEYLRLLLESMQQASVCFSGKDVPPNDPLLATTLVQQIFGGRLRSRVTCHSCRHHSDTYDPAMDLSLDVRKGINNVKQALEAFTAPEALADKYQCDSCRARVDATKRFTVDRAPLALTVHLKRFGLLGNKINKPVSYTERLHLGRYMSERKGSADTEAYRLYAIVHHYGSGPHVGHYVASVRAADGQWLRMDDSDVSPLRQCPVDDPSAYVLFYLREPSAPEAPGASAARATAPPSPAKREAPVARLDDTLGEPVSRAAFLQAQRRGSESDDDAWRALGEPVSSPGRRRKKRKRVLPAAM